MRPFDYFNCGRKYEVLKLKSPCVLLNKNIKFTKSETKKKMENPTHNFREMNSDDSTHKVIAS